MELEKSCNQMVFSIDTFANDFTSNIISTSVTRCVEKKKQKGVFDESGLKDFFDQVAFPTDHQPLAISHDLADLADMDLLPATLLNPPRAPISETTMTTKDATSLWSINCSAHDQGEPDDYAFIDELEKKKKDKKRKKRERRKAKLARKR